ncbi:MAG: sulfotransferase [Spirochaetaceae bacterium]|nr:sulfotransferase [Myxococcales bacterium]MCB9724135.1 sulfotransferase [Spirochaetaceae bacterium]HPG27419.1 sulfotransferase [Myxococcota bacterium]
MALQIIGAGFGRTGTVSMKAALEQLGFGPCYHMREILKPRPGFNDGHLAAWSEHARARQAGRPHTLDWDFIFARYAACMDHPTCLYYEELMEKYPDAKVILTVRDPKRWFQSWQTLFEGLGFLRRLAPFVRRVRQGLDIVDVLIRDGEMGGRIEPESNIAIFERHNREVVERVPADRLLVFDVRQGWEPLCAFLGVDVPDTPFPHLNESKGSIRARLLQFWLETTSPRARATLAVGSAAILAFVLTRVF